MSTIELRAMKAGEWSAVAELIYDSTNAWYQSNGRPPFFSGPKENARLFCEVYERLDPGCCLVAEVTASGRLAGSCFYHPRPSHVSLGIMNVHPDYFRQGIGRRLLKHITDIADQQKKPMRLVSSTINLDSFSLYNRAGFVPRMIFQDMIMQVPEDGLPFDVPGLERVRPATLQDVPIMAALEENVLRIQRENDLRCFVENPGGIWHVSVLEATGDGIEGFLVSVNHPGCNMLGPGVMRTEEQAAALILAELNHHCGRQPVWLVPSKSESLVRVMYEWGAKNCELHFAQVRGPWTPPVGIVMPTFMPETG